LAVFDNIERTRTDVPHQDERQFAYLNASARAKAASVRALIEEWITHYPEEHRPALIMRLRSNIDDEHRSAFFELFVHELLMMNGHKILEIEPTLPHTTKKPDFLVEAAGGFQFCLECVMATGKSKEEVGATNRLNQALKVIDTFPCETHFLDITPRGLPTTPVPLNKLKAMLGVWVGKLKLGQQSTVPFRYVHNGLTIRISAFPKSKPKAGRSIAVRHFPVRTTTFDETLRDAVEKKAKKYGKLEMPYLIAANTFPFVQTETDIMDSLLGTSFIRVAMMKDGTSKQEEVREPNGVWRGPDGSRNQVVSAVLAMKDISPWNFATKIARLVRNPWATKPLPLLPLGVYETNPIEGIWKKTEGKSMGEIFNLPDGWPEA
jgi:hypothetical protein